MALEVGSLLNNRYRINHVIAQGGMGAIYKAADESLGVLVALKENLFSNEDASRQFRREATILAGLRHPNLPRVTDHFVISGQGQYLVMDFIDGEDLHKRINRLNTVNEEDVILIGCATCDALTYMHSRQPPIVHRDIKPGNLKITPNGQVILVDFGLAKASRPGEATTIGAQALTPGFAPPEQYGKGTDPRSDIYALAATLYAALTAKTPEDGLARAMGSAGLTPIRHYNSKISDRVAAVIEKAMAVMPEDRFQTAEEFRQALLNVNTSVRKRGAQSGEIRLTPAPEKPDLISPTVDLASVKGSTGYTPAYRPAAKKFPIGILAGIVLVVLIGMGAAGLFLLGLLNPPASQKSTATVGSQPPTPALAVVENTRPPTLLPSNTPVPPTSAPTATPAPTMTFTPAATTMGGGGGQIAFTSDRVAGLPQIFVMNIDGSGIKQITKLQDGACQSDWSPDGKKMVIVSPCRSKRDNYNGSSLFIINNDGSGLLPLPSVPGGDYDPAWSPDGERIAFTSLRDGANPHIYILTLKDNKTIRLTGPASYDRRPAWSPDGSEIAFDSTRAGSPMIWITEAKAGSQARAFTELTFSVMPAWSPNGNIMVYSQGGTPGLVGQQISVKSQAAISTLRPAYKAEFSPDSYWLALETTKDGNSEVYLMTTNGANLTNLTNDKSTDFHPSWRPAGN